jgi:hypothetical protein
LLKPGKLDGSMWPSCRVFGSSCRNEFASFSNVRDRQSRFLTQGLYNRYPITETSHCHG